MTLENLFSQMGVGTKQLTDRYTEYTGPAHDQQVYYAYEPSVSTQSHVTHVASSKHHYSGGHKSGASMSALTLLAFLFFLHILQQCIKDHMAEMTTPPVMIMTAGREGDDTVSKTVVSKLDKAGVSRIDSSNKNNEQYPTDSSFEKYDAKNPYDDAPSHENQLIKITASDYTQKTEDQKFKYVFKNHANRSSGFSGFKSATQEDYDLNKKRNLENKS